MQVYELALKEGTRPCAGRQCPQCGGEQVLHKHGCYWRWRNVDGAERERVQRYLCPRCGHTWSVVPAGMMPYRSLEVRRFEQLADEWFGLTDGGARPPPATENEHGCIRRALKKLSKRIPLLCGFLGQRMPVLDGTDTGGFWRALRELGSTEGILVALARDFKSSLLGCYRSLRAFWEREHLPVTGG